MRILKVVEEIKYGFKFYINTKLRIRSRAIFICVHLVFSDAVSRKTIILSDTERD
jgi:hypothetical protein